MIREATPDDLEEVLALSQNYFSDEARTFNFLFEMDVSFHFSVYEVNNKIAGFVTGIVEPSLCEVYRLVRGDSYSKLGVGTQLLHHFVDHAKRNGAKKVELECNSSNESALKLYEQTGFTYIGDDEYRLSF